MSVDLSALLTLPNLLAGLGLALVGLTMAVAAVRRAARGVELARVPVAPQSDVRLDVAGSVVLAGEGPRFTSRFGGLDFRLVERATGATVPQRVPWVHTTVAGWSRVRLTLARFEIPRPGLFRLDVTALAPGTRDDDCAFVFMPPTGAALPIAIVGCVVAGAALVGALVALAWMLLARAPVPGTGAHAPSAATPAVLASAGRRLADAPVATGATQEVRWSGPGLVLRVPAEWQIRAADAELDLRTPARTSSYLVGHAVLFPSPTRADLLMRVALESAAERLAAGLIEGYETVRWAGIDGVLTIEARSDAASRIAVWNAYRGTSKGVQNLTILFGADAAEFDRLAAVARAVLASARFDRAAPARSD